MIKETIKILIASVCTVLFALLLPAPKSDKNAVVGKRKKPSNVNELGSTKLGIDSDGNAVMKGDMTDVT